MHRLNLQSKIILMVMPLVVLPVILLGWYSYDTLEQSSRKNLLGQMNTLLNQVEHSARSHLSTARANVELFSDSHLLEKYVLTQEEADRYALLQPSLMRLFAGYQRAYPEYYEMRILMPDGYEDTRSTITPLPNESEYENDTKYFRGLLAAGDEIYATYAFNEDNGDPVLYIGKQLLIRDESIEPLNVLPSLRGYLVISSDLTHLQQQLEMHRLGNDGYLFVTDEEGQKYFTTHDPANAGFDVGFDTNDRLTALSGRIIHTELQGKDVYLQGRRVHKDLHLYAVLPAEDLHSASWDLGIIVALVTLIAIILVSVLVFVLINWILIHPIRRLGMFAHEIGLGDFDAESDIKSEDEIGDLARSLKEMSTNLKRSQEQVRYLAYRDALTGLPNRRMFQEYIQRAAAHARRKGTSFALLFMDLDNFKQVNDSLGHQAGDKLLHDLAQRLSESMRKEDQVSHPGTDTSMDEPEGSVARLGGDEFLILISDVNEPSEVAHIAQRLLDMMSDPFEIGGNSVFVGGSIGISMYPGDGKDVDTLIKHADVAMYHAKENGRHNYQFYNDSMNTATIQRLALENDLRNAIKNRELLLNYQPKLDMSNGNVESVEALLRWHHPVKGVVEPNRFIPIAESTGLILEIGEWMINEAIRQVTSWQNQGINLTVSINISIVQLNKQDLLDTLKNSLNTSGCNAEWLEIELTETSIMEAYEHASKMLHEIKALGVAITMDDFGVGYSSFSFLRNLPIDILKIDRSFVRDITTDQKDAEIISAIIAMAHSLNLQVVAEGVETIEQMHFLQSRQCDIAQGFLISRPLTAQQLTEFIKTPGKYDFRSSDSPYTGRFKPGYRKRNLNSK